VQMSQELAQCGKFSEKSMVIALVYGSANYFTE